MTTEIATNPDDSTVEVKTAAETTITEDTTQDSAKNEIEEEQIQVIDSTPEEKIVRQLEFYLCDSNLRVDKFMRTQIQLDGAGWVSLNVIKTFARMKTLASEGLAQIVGALEQVGSQSIKLNEEKDAISRIVPYKHEDGESTDTEVLKRTLYFKGIPSDAKLDQILAVFNPLGATCVRMRRFHAKDPINPKGFKGSVFVEFATEDAANNCGDVKYGKNTLLMMTKTDYIEMKKKEVPQNDNKRKRTFAGKGRSGRKQQKTEES